MFFYTLLIINTIIWTTGTFKNTTFDDCVTKLFFNGLYNKKTNHRENHPDLLI
jgi:hypothetical protein